MIRFIMTSCGYVESSSVSTVIWGLEYTRAKESFATKAEALTELALDMYAKFCEECPKHSRSKTCCKKAVAAKNGSNYCPKCGNYLADLRFDWEEFVDMIQTLQNGDANSYGESETASGRRIAWAPWDTTNLFENKGEDVLIVSENAELVILAALLEAKPELNHDEIEVGMGQDDWETLKKEKT